MTQRIIKATPLGGVGEIGALNCMVYESPDEAVIVDCGSQFPDDESMGVDLIIPDFSYLRSLRKKLRGVVFTHGHEDHVGAAPFLLQEFDIPVFATPFTAGLIRQKLDEYSVRLSSPIHVFKPGEAIKTGSLSVDTVFVNHSIIDASALVLEGEGGALVHLTDWKIDRTSIDGVMTDLKKFSQIGKKGVMALFSDSTNVDQPGSTLSERAIEKQVKKICAAHRGRILVTLFASNINRIQALAGVAKSLGRVLAFVGRSMHENTALARELGRLSLDGIEVLDIEETRSLNPEKVMVLLTGSQGEERSALTRIAFNQFKPFRIQEGDLVLFSSKVIPGNERNIFHVINHLYRNGARVLYESVHEIHTSGHAHQDELKEAVNRLKPRYFVPIHGTYRHFVVHGELAQTCGVKKENVLIIENGQSLLFNRGGATRGDVITTGRVFVDGRGVGDVSDLVIRDRRALADTGIVICVLMIDRVNGQIVRGPDLISRGFIDEKERPGLLDAAKKKLLESLSGLNLDEMTELLDVQEEVRLSLRRFFKKELERKPVVIPVVLEV